MGRDEGAESKNDRGWDWDDGALKRWNGGVIANCNLPFGRGAHCASVWVGVWEREIDRQSRCDFVPKSPDGRPYRAFAGLGDVDYVCVHVCVFAVAVILAHESNSRPVIVSAFTCI